MPSSKRTYKRINHNKPWSKSDTQRFAELYCRNHDHKLARIFGRTAEAIRTKGARMGLKKNWDEDFKPYHPFDVRRWSPLEITVLKRMHATHTFVDISDKIDRSPSAIAAKARLLKLRKQKLWTKRDDKLLQRNCKKKSYVQLARMLDRTPRAIEKRAADIGLDRKFAWWTGKELDLLVKNYPTMRTRELARLIGRSPEQVRMKAYVLGIRKDRERIFSGGRRWSKTEVDEILRLYKNHTTRQVAALLDYPYMTVRRLFKRLNGLVKLKPWTKKEDRIMRKYCKRISYKKLAEKLGRSIKSVGSRAETLGLIGKNIWSQKDIRVLKEQFNKSTPVKKIAALLGKSRNTCNYKITALDLR
jgi:hypothetical protein